MKKVIIVLGVALIFLGIIVGCGQKGSGREKEKEVGKREKGVLGKYVNQDDPQEYVELKNDGTVYVKEKFPWNDYHEMKGKWEIGSDELLLIDPLGGVDRCKIKGNTLIDGDGKIWTKQEETRNITKETSSEKKVSKDSIVGRYIVEDLRKDGSKKTYAHGVTIFRADGRIVLKSSDSEFVIPNQRWEFKNGIVQIHQGEGKFLEGSIEGDAIVFKESGVELKYTKLQATRY